MSLPGENEKQREVPAPAEQLEWQSELDSAMSDLDSRLKLPRRLASDVAPRPAAPWVADTPPVVIPPARRAVPEGTSIVIRLPRPLFSFRLSWKFWRRRRRRHAAAYLFQSR
jgi:hypothetical protein